MLAACESRADEVEATVGAVAAFSQALAALPPAGGLATPATSSASAVATPFQVRRVTNPRYRPPTPTAPGIGPGAVSRMRALDRLGMEVFHQGNPAPGSVTQWRIAAGEQYRSNDELEVVAAGGRQRGAQGLQALRLSGRLGALSGSLGDAEPFSLGRLGFIQRLRGGVVRLAGSDQSQWLALGGVPTPLPGFPTPRIGLGGLMAEGIRFEEGTVSFTAVGFTRAASPAPVPRPADADTLAGGGTAAVFGWRAPAGRGTLAGRLGAQLHDLDGQRSLAAQHAIEWSLITPQWAVSLSDERGTRRARLLGTDRFAPTPRREDRWNLQTRFGQARSEAHFIGVLRDGGDPTLEARTVQLGGSGALGAAGWYGGGDATWDRHAGFEEQRLSLHAGGALPRGHALLARIEYAARAGGDLLATVAEASVALPRGARLELEPRSGWSDGRFDQGQLTTRLTWPANWLSARITGGLTLGAARDDAFRGVVREASIALSCAPRLRDRADLEARRVDSGGRAVMEYNAAYDAQRERYQTIGGWNAARDTGRVTVQVVRSGNRSGVSDVVVSLDGRQLRFTDADGIARFEHVPPGVHVVAVEEHSLPENHQVVSASRVFVTVERDRAPAPVSFTIARQERRTRF